MRKIHQIIHAEKVNMGGILLDQPLPAGSIEMIDPFLLIHHWNQHYNGGNLQKELGVGPHPHRGFVPVTFIFKGGLHHRDSRGNDSVVYAGGTQWIHSGMGLIHSERPAREIAENGGDLELIQFWINLPAMHKMDQPVYQPITEKETPTFLSENKMTKVMVITGEFQGIKGVVHPVSPMLILRINLKKNGKLSVPVPSNFNALIYLLDGSLKTGGKQIGEKNLVWYERSEGNILLEAFEDSRLILLSGNPLNEPVAASGPFVMNNTTEIMEAMRDYRMGKMGFLAEEFS